MEERNFKLKNINENLKYMNAKNIDERKNVYLHTKSSCSWENDTNQKKRKMKKKRKRKKIIQAKKMKVKKKKK